jgi:hypothetical protein
MMAADFFVVPTVTYRMLFVLVILSHEQRRLVHVAVARHPPRRGPPNNSVRLPHDEAPRFLLHDRDIAFAAIASTIDFWAFATSRQPRAHYGRTALPSASSAPFGGNVSTT